MTHIDIKFSYEPNKEESCVATLTLHISTAWDDFDDPDAARILPKYQNYSETLFDDSLHEIWGFASDDGSTRYRDLKMTARKWETLKDEVDDFIKEVNYQLDYIASIYETKIHSQPDNYTIQLD
jgi:hypothetical protein